MPIKSFPQELFIKILSALLLRYIKQIISPCLLSLGRILRVAGSLSIAFFLSQSSVVYNNKLVAKSPRLLKHSRMANVKRVKSSAHCHDNFSPFLFM